MANAISVPVVHKNLPGVTVERWNVSTVQFHFVADIVRFAVALTFLDTIVEFYDSKDGYQRREVSA